MVGVFSQRICKDQIFWCFWSTVLGLFCLGIMYVLEALYNRKGYCSWVYGELGFSLASLSVGERQHEMTDNEYTLILQPR